VVSFSEFAERPFRIAHQQTLTNASKALLLQDYFLSRFVLLGALWELLLKLQIEAVATSFDKSLNRNLFRGRSRKGCRGFSAALFLIFRGAVAFVPKRNVGAKAPFENSNSIWSVGMYHPHSKTCEAC